MDASERDAWREADRIFTRLLGLPEDQRSQHLAQLDIDDTVRRHVQSLLASADSDLDWLDRATAIDQGGGTDAGSRMLGRRLGPWLIEEELGRGGMAVVYRASRCDGVAAQSVALKILTIGAISRDGLVHFRRETTILARLEHPDIVGLVDAGVDEDGTPWLAMPLVNGDRIDTWCQSRKADTRTIVKLIMQVCAAVAHAHRKLIIHRDIKPSNVLVDDHGRVRLLDFGIAAFASQGEGGTQSQWRAFTPNFAAPEQLAGQPPSTAMDIYGLGALLHCLLTDGPPPSRSDTTASATARNAPVTTVRRRTLSGDLSRIVAKALDLDPDERYATAEALSLDLERWSEGRPVSARVPSTGYRLRRFVGRNRALVGATLVIAILLAASIATSLWQNARIRAEGERAIVTRDLLIDILEAADPTVSDGVDPPASELLRRGAERIQARLADRPDVLAELLLVIGRSQLNRAQLDDAADVLDKARNLHETHRLGKPSLLAETLNVRAQLAYEQGRTSEGIELAQTAERIAARSGPSELHRRIQARLADLLMFNRRLDEASELATRLVNSTEARDGEPLPHEYYRALMVLGTVADIQGDRDQAVSLLERAAAGFQNRADSARILANIHNTLGVAYLGAGQFQQAESALQAALATQTRLFGADHPETLVTRSNLGGVLLKSGQPGRAADVFDQILIPQRAHAGGRPHPDVAIVLGYLAQAHYLAGDSPSALAAAESAHAELAAVAEKDRAGLEWIGAFTGLMRLEQEQPDPDNLLAQARSECPNPPRRRSVMQWLCLAKAMVDADRGHCRTPAGDPPIDIDALDGIDRRWWAAYWLVVQRCGGSAVPDHVGTALQQLEAGADPPFPDWLKTRIRHASGHAP